MRSSWNYLLLLYILHPMQMMVSGSKSDRATATSLSDGQKLPFQFFSLDSSSELSFKLPRGWWGSGPRPWQVKGCSQTMGSHSGSAVVKETKAVKTWIGQTIAVF